MTALDSLLIAAITALVGGIVGLWRYIIAQAHSRLVDQQESARLIFALLQRLALERGEKPPLTKSSPHDLHPDEAKALAKKELNGEIESLVKAYLASELPPRMSLP